MKTTRKRVNKFFLKKREKGEKGKKKQKNNEKGEKEKKNKEKKRTVKEASKVPMLRSSLPPKTAVLISTPSPQVGGTVASDDPRSAFHEFPPLFHVTAQTDIGRICLGLVRFRICIGRHNGKHGKHIFRRKGFVHHINFAWTTSAGVGSNQLLCARCNNGLTQCCLWPRHATAENGFGTRLAFHRLRQRLPDHVMFFLYVCRVRVQLLDDSPRYCGILVNGQGVVVQFPPQSENSMQSTWFIALRTAPMCVLPLRTIFSSPPVPIDLPQCQGQS